MNDLKGLRVVVAGAGAMGSVAALVLARAGADVTLADPTATGDNASGVAAGMLAPASEALLDPKSAGHFALYRAARDAWPALLEPIPGAPALDRSGAILKAAQPDELLARAGRMGAVLEPMAEAEARRRAPGLAAAGPFLFTPEDWRLEPGPMLACLHDALEREGGRRLPARALGLQGGSVALEGGQALAADVLVQATGPGLGDLTPIKGQILRFPGLGPGHGPVVRGEGVYVAATGQGMVAGATMEEGLADRSIDPQAVARLQAAAARLFPALAEARPLAFAGVRAATPDGLPLVGRGPERGVLLARGARRNGWLLAPLAAQVVVDVLKGVEPSEAGRAFDPARIR